MYHGVLALSPGSALCSQAALSHARAASPFPGLFHCHTLLGDMQVAGMRFSRPLGNPKYSIACSLFDPWKGFFCFLGALYSSPLNISVLQNLHGW